jgi:hypothetical protein
MLGFFINQMVWVLDAISANFAAIRWRRFAMRLILLLRFSRLDSNLNGISVETPKPSIITKWCLPSWLRA